jgi:hypothetical protein
MHESFVHEYLYFMYHTTCVCYFSFSFDVIWSLPLCDAVFDFQMSEYSLPYIGFANGASRSTRNLASTAWQSMPQQTSLYLYEVYVLGGQPTTLQSIVLLLSYWLMLSLLEFVVWLCDLTRN